MQGQLEQEKSRLVTEIGFKAKQTEQAEQLMKASKEETQNLKAALIERTMEFAKRTSEWNKCISDRNCDLLSDLNVHEDEKHESSLGLLIRKSANPADTPRAATDATSPSQDSSTGSQPL